MNSTRLLATFHQSQWGVVRPSLDMLIRKKKSCMFLQHLQPWLGSCCCPWCPCRGLPRHGGSHQWNGVGPCGTYEPWIVVPCSVQFNVDLGTSLFVLRVSLLLHQQKLSNRSEVFTEPIKSLTTSYKIQHYKNTAVYMTWPTSGRHLRLTYFDAMGHCPGRPAGIGV